MAISIPQIREALKTPKKTEVIKRAVQHQERLRFHSEVALTSQTTSAAASDFLTWVSTKIPDDKFRIFASLFRYPVKTVKETDKIYDALGKVFDGQNPVFKYDFVSPELGEDWNDFLTEEQCYNKWHTDGLETMRLAINSIIVVDMPTEQEGKYPEPYFYFLDICHMIDYMTDGDHEFDWVIFRQDEKTIVVIDDQFYRKLYFESNPDNMVLLSEVPHDIKDSTGEKYCPARFFWSEKLSKNDPDIRLSPITTNLGDLDWLLYFMIAKQHLDLYAGYPIYSAYEKDCDFENDGERGYVRCDRGFLKDVNNQYIMSWDGGVSECPVCKDKRLSGPGTYFEVPKPGPENDNADMRNPVQITTIDKHSLDYNTGEQERLIKQLYENITGYGGEPNTEQAMNVKQILAAVESRTAILRDFKKNFEMAMEWTDYTMARARYGDLFLGCYINLGTDFYFLESQYLLTLYQTAKLAEADDATLDSLQDQYYMTEYRNSPDQLKRVMIINNLDPARHLSKTKAGDLYEKGMIKWEDYQVKLKFSTFVMRFERDNAPLIEFGKNLSFDKRIKKIKTIIYSYVDQRPKTPDNQKASTAAPSQATAN